MKLIDLLLRLQHVEWSWQLSRTEEIVSGLAGAPLKRLDSRLKYGLEGFEDVSLYYEAAEALALEMTIESCRQPYRLTPAEYEDKVDEYFRKYETTVATVSGVLGKPVFDDGAGGSGFPDDQEAVWLALWWGSNARIMIQQKHEDRDAAFRLCVLVAPLSPAAGGSS
jgi:hypothetical protein